MTKMTVEEIRAALVRGKVGLGRPYPEAAREAVKELVAQRRKDGTGVSSIAEELGVSATTLRKWVRKDRTPRAKRKFREVEVVAATPVSATLIVHGPAGLRIEGATIADVAELVRRLG